MKGLRNGIYIKRAISILKNDFVSFNRTTFVQQFDIYWVAQESVAVQVRAVNDTDVTTTAIPTVTVMKLDTFKRI